MRQVHATVIGIVLSAVAAVPAAAQMTMQAAPPAATSASKGATPAPAASLINDAVKAAKANKKAVLVYFGASWCGYCHKFDTFLHSPEVGKLMADNYEFVHLITQESPDKKALENPGADSIMKAMGMASAGIPTFFILDGDGKKLATSMVMPPDGSNMGHPATPEEVKTFGDILEKTAPHMAAADRTKITDYLTAMAKQ